MNPEILIDKATTNGLGNVLSILIVLAFFWLLMFVMKQNEKREERLANIIEKSLNQLSEKFDNVNRYHRDEHAEILKTINEIACVK